MRCYKNKHLEVFDFLEAYLGMCVLSPRIEEVAYNADVSCSYAWHMLNDLGKAGCLKRKKKSRRGWSVCNRELLVAKVDAREVIE